MGRFGWVPLLVAAGSGMLSLPAVAGWPTLPTQNLPVFTGGTAGPDAPVAVKDGSCGAIVVWTDRRGNLSLGFGIYAQHVLEYGEVDPRWPNQGTAITTNGSLPSRPVSVPDGNGGAFVSWYREGICSGDPTDISCYNSIRVQRLLSSGIIDPAWPSEGMSVSTVGAFPFEVPHMIFDGAGGALIAFDAWGAWQPNLGRYEFLGLRLQHVLRSGVLDPAWPLGGRQVSPGRQGVLDLPGEALWDLAPDGNGGALVAWRGAGAVPNVSSLSVQHVLASGQIDSGWPSNGAAVLDPAFSANDVQLVPDNAGGVLLAWTEQRNRADEADIFAHHLLASGTLDPAWPISGLPICAAPEEQQFPRMATNGRGGALITWEDGRKDYTDIFAQEVQARSALGREANGTAVCVAPQYQTKPTIISDEAGGALVVWEDFRTAPLFGVLEPFVDIYAQHLLNAGKPDPSWPVDGQPVTIAPDGQGPLSAVGDDRGGVIVVWRDNRQQKGDIYAQRVSRHGELGESGISRLASRSDSHGFDTPIALELSSPCPNPARYSVTLEYRLSRQGVVRLEIYDSSGRRVRTLAEGEAMQGVHVLAWDFRDASAKEVSSGLYFARLETAEGEKIRRLVKF